MIEVRRDTTATPTAVWDVLRDGWLYPSWVVGAARIRGVEPRWPAVGARIHHSVGLWPLLLDDNTEVLAAEPPHAVTLQARGWPLGEARIEIRTLPRPNGGSTIVMREDADRGPGKLVPKPVRRVLIVPRNVETLRRLAYLAEGRSR